MKIASVLLFTSVALGAAPRYFEGSWGSPYEDAPVISCQDRPGLRCNPSIGLDCCPLLDCTAECPGCWGYVSDLFCEAYNIQSSEIMTYIANSAGRTKCRYLWRHTTLLLFLFKLNVLLGGRHIKSNNQSWKR